ATGAVRVIITSARGRRDDIKKTLKRRGRNILAEHGFINAFTTEIDATELREIAGDPAVDHVSLDAEIHTHQSTIGPLSANMLLPTLGLPDTTYTGKDVGVAV